MTDYYMLYDRIGLCDQCIAKVKANPDQPLQELLCDRCLAKLNAFFNGLLDGDAQPPNWAEDWVEAIRNDIEADEGDE